MSRSAPSAKAALSAFTWLSKDLAAKAAFSGPAADGSRRNGLGIKGKSHRGSNFSTSFDTDLVHRRGGDGGGRNVGAGPTGRRAEYDRCAEQRAGAASPSEPTGFRAHHAFGHQGDGDR